MHEIQHWLRILFCYLWHSIQSTNLFWTIQNLSLNEKSIKPQTWDGPKVKSEDESQGQEKVSLYTLFSDT